MHAKRSARLLVAGLTVGAMALLTAACGQSSDDGTPQHVAQARYDRSLHDRLPQSVLRRGVLRVGTDASYAPMSSFGPDGRTIIGMEPDLGAKLGRILGVRVKFVNTDFTSIIAKVAHGHLDLGMSAITDTPQRERMADFIDYFSAGTSILVQRGNPRGITDVTDLCGKPVAVETGTTQADLLARTQGNCGADPINVKTYATNPDALLQLRTGRVAAVLNDLPPAAFLANDPRTKAYYQLASTTQYEPGLYGIVVAKKQLGLRDAAQGALEELLRSGAYAHVVARWGVQGGAVDQVTINSGR